MSFVAHSLEQFRTHGKHNKRTTPPNIMELYFHKIIFVSLLTSLSATSFVPFLWVFFSLLFFHCFVHSAIHVHCTLCGCDFRVPRSPVSSRSCRLPFGVWPHERVSARSQSWFVVIIATSSSLLYIYRFRFVDLCVPLAARPRRKHIQMRPPSPFCVAAFGGG